VFDLDGRRGATISPMKGGLPQAPQMQPEAAAEEVSIKSLLTAIWRRRWMVLAVQGLVLVLTIVWLAHVKPVYVATSMVVLNAVQPEVLRVDPAAPGFVAKPGGVQTEMQVLSSPALAERVITKLDLVDDPELNPRIGPPPSLFQVILDYIDPRVLMRRAINLLREPRPTPQGSSAESNPEMTYVVGGFLNRLTVANPSQSYGISVSFASEDPTKAAQIANTLVDQYLVSQLEAKYESMRRANAWLADRLDDLKAQVEQSERAVQAYKEKANLVQTRGETISAQQLSELNSQLVIARTDLAAAQSRLRGMRGLVKTGQVNSAPEILQSDYIQTLKQQEVDLSRTLADLKTRYGDRHPQIINARAQLKEVQQKLSREVQQVVASLETEVAVLQTRAATLEQNLQSAKVSAESVAREEVQLAELQREADANRAIYQDFLTRFKETGSQVNIQQADARIVSRAREPVYPAYPRMTLVLTAAIFGGLVLGLVLVVLAEQFDNRLRTAEQIETAVGESVIGMVPEVRKFIKGRLPHELLTQRPDGAYSESLHAILAALHVYHSGPSSPVFLVTSALPEDGKTTMVLSLGIVAALSGRRVIVVDADLRRHQLTSLTSLKPELGLTEYLMSNATLEEIVHQHPSGLAVLPTKPRKSGKPEWSFIEKRLLSSDRMRMLMDTLARQYDLVIIDSPPVNILADASMLAAFASYTLFVVRWGRSTRNSLQAAVQQLRRAGATIGGVILGRVDLRRHSAYGYRDQAYYYGRGQKYYRLRT
jgi:capsular exopolysaccharide synthesis family protein